VTPVTEVTPPPRAPAVVVVGSLNRDYVCTVDRLPGRGETRLGSELALWCGGKGGNQAVAAALMGAGVRVAMVGAVGDDDDGRALLEGLRAAGVDVEDVGVRRGARSGAALVTVADDGDNTIVVAPGANLTVSADEVRAVLRRREPAVVIVQGELPPSVVAATLGEAAALGARPILNLAPVIEVPDAVLRSCDPLLVNAGEAAALLGRAVSGADELESAARDLSRRARSAVVTAGASGSWVAERGEAHHVPARAADVVDTTGAGDAFTGALGVALALGHHLVEAAQRGAVVAAYAVGRPGAQASFPRRTDLGWDESVAIP
jgi:ribokinase